MKKWLKKALAVAILGMFAMSLAGCGSTEKRIRGRRC